MDKVTKIVEMRDELSELVKQTLDEKQFEEVEHFYTMMKIAHSLYTRYHSGRNAQAKSSILT